MKIKLQKLNIKNFKSIKNFELNLEGKSAIIAAQNGAGKTTIADAFFWLFSGADSSHQAKFNIITQDNSGGEISGLNASVEALLNINGDDVALKRELSQKWIKKRGQADAEFTGHGTEFWWNGVSVKKKEFEANLAEICNPFLLRSLSDVYHFCGRMKPDDRRRTLIDIMGNVDDQMIIDAYPDLAELPNILDGRTIEDAKKILSSRSKAANKQLKELPVRIDTIRQMAPDVSGIDEVNLRNDLKAVEDKIDQNKKDLLGLGSGIETLEAKKRVKELELKVFEIESKITNQTTSKVAEIERNIRDKKGRIEDKKYMKNRSLSDIKRLETTIESNQAERTALKKELKEVRASKFEAESKVCFACGTPLKKELLDKQEEEFNLYRSDKIAKIDESGKRLFADFNLMKEVIVSKREDIQAYGQAEISLEEEIKALEKKIHETNNSSQMQMDQETTDINHKIAEYSNMLDGIEGDLEPARNALEKELIILNNQKEDLDFPLRQIRAWHDNQVLLNKYESDLKDNAAAYELAEGQLYTIEQFTRRRAEFIEEKVSEKFATIIWKLFDLQMNQGVREMCEATVGGVLYTTNLNTGAKINAGLDAIKVLSEHHKISLPVFVDNAESVTSWLDFDGQIIKLMANPEFKNLEVITDE